MVAHTGLVCKISVSAEPVRPNDGPAAYHEHMRHIRVLIADDQDIIRQGLQIIVDQQDDMTALPPVADGMRALQAARELRPDVVLMDIKMPVMDGIEATRAIARELPATQVIILTTYDSDDLVFDGARAGAQGYLLKDAGSAAILEAVRAVQRGESQLDPQIARKMMDEFRRVSPAPASAAKAARSTDAEGPALEALTERETDILTLLAQGLSGRDIAQSLHITEGTLRNHISNVLGKLHVNDRTQAIVAAARRGIIRF